MPIPSRKKDEDREQFMSRCMSDDNMKKDYKQNQQRIAVCLTKASEGMSSMAAADLRYNVEEFGYTEELTEENFYIPSEDEYETVAGEQEEDWDIATARPGLWENIRRKKEREGKNYKPARTEKEGRPTQEQLKKAQSENDLLPKGHPRKSKAAEYQGRKVKLGKPFRTPDGPKKFSVYVKNEKGNVVKVNFGDPNMEIKRDDPARRKSFRARHKCDTNPGPRWKARYWSCKFW